MEDKITLDRKTFKTLASDTRVGILKSLARRRKMLTELSKEFGMSPSTIKEHLDNLSRAELVVQMDEGHKWKYYELTGKGKDVLNPGETKIWIVLVLSAIAILATTYDFFQRSFQGTFNAMAQVGEMAKALPPEVGAQPLYLPHWHIIAFVVFSIVLGVSLWYIFGKRRFYAFQGE
jgi:DNA-binding transcriptional ArsR family regulator